MHTHRALVLLPLAALVVVSGCSSSSRHQSVDAPLPLTSSAAPAGTTSPTAVPGAAGAGAAPRTAAAGRAEPSATAAAAAPRAGTGTRQEAVRPTAAGTYTYDSSGSQTLSGGSRAVDATSTLTVSPASGGRQSSTLHDAQGDTRQDVVLRPGGTWLGALSLTSPTLSKDFRFDPPVLLLPDPGTPGARWSWQGTSTDGSTTVSAANQLVRRETLTVGGERVATVVLQTHLVITGKDLRYTADQTSWVAPAYRLPVRTHSKGSGTYGAFPFSFDITDALRSVHPA
jgi:hypothetical protein